MSRSSRICSRRAKAPAVSTTWRCAPRPSPITTPGPSACAPPAIPTAARSIASIILIEIATDEPGFATDEPAETMGEALSLPPFLEGRRAAIEAGLKPL